MYLEGGGDHLNNFFLSESNSKPLAHPHDQCCSINCTSYYCAPLSLTKAFSLIQDAVDRHQTHQTYNRKERSQVNLELNHLALFRGLNSSLIQDAFDLICPQMQGK